jgi:O-antigen ligase
MFETVESEYRWNAAITAGLLLIVGLTPLGNEATQPLIFIVYRTLLAGVIAICLLAISRNSAPSISPVFLAAGASSFLFMLFSFLGRPGSNFEGFYRWYQLVLFALAFLVLTAFFQKQGLGWKYTVLAGVVAIDVTYLTVELVLGHQPVIGPFVNPNYFASFLLAGFSIGAALTLFANTTWMRVGGAVVSLYLYYGMTQAWSRGATLAALGVVLVAALRFGRQHAISWLRIGIAMAILAALAAIASPTLLNKFMDGGERDPYNYMRPKVWMSTLTMIGEHPLLGVGLGQYNHVSKKFTAPVEGSVARYLKRPGIAHSEYLQYAAETGLPAALLLFGTAGYLLWTAAWKTRFCSAESRAIQEAAILVAVAIGTHALVDNNWTVPVMAVGLIVFSLADCLPKGNWKFRFPVLSRTALVAAAMITVVVLAHSILIPGLALYFNERGHRAYLAKDLHSAEAWHRAAAAIVPDQSVFLDNAGLAYFDMYMTGGDRKYLDFAQTFFRAAMEANPNADEPRRHMESALIQRLTGQVKRDKTVHLSLIELDREILRIDPFNPFVRKNLAEALYNSGSHNEAEQEMLRTIEAEPNYVPAYLRLADWYQEKGRMKESATYRNRAIDIVSRYQNVQMAERYEALLLGRPDPQMNQGQAVQQ